ncbi:hypothetical protein [Paenibacillus donghaensis]|uniref:Integrase catalytic domain-containing protein n=1 Tax=Paenibacillus donghaensis TaxID=414771 RepID=A0A2Z2KLU3_9BACL|nr:hypothetical protein [Paenibacillus donghaensis]ASA23469.1 hypothetical protein B9T62_23275 [Paenibacillus donghaensis]
MKLNKKIKALRRPWCRKSKTKSIVSVVLGHSNNNELVLRTFDIAHKTYPEVKPLFHSDRGFQVRQEVA